MGGWSVMVMILCVYKWAQILVSVCVQVSLNVYKWSLCTSDPFLCVQVSPLPLAKTEYAKLQWIPEIGSPRKDRKKELYSLVGCVWWALER